MNKKVIFILIGVISLASCSDDFLERPPLNDISEDTFWTSEEDLYKAVNAVYNQLPGAGVMYDDGASDNAHAQYPWESASTNIAAGDITSALDVGWGYTDKTRANYFLENADKVTSIGPELLERYKAEVRFIRAYSYFRMMNKFGSIPLLTETKEMNEVDVPRTPQEEVHAFIINELAEVAQILPATYSGGKPNEKGRITKGAALALKARAHLYAQQWDAAAQAASEVMTLGYDLFQVSPAAVEIEDDYSQWVDFSGPQEEAEFLAAIASYEGLFHQRNEGNVEVILDRQYIPQVDAHYLNTYLPPGTIGGWSSLTPTQSLVDSYWDYQTGQLPTLASAQERGDWYTSGDEQFYDQYRNRDPRFYASILFPRAPWNAIEDNFEFEWIKGASNMSQTGYNFRKLVDPAIFRENLDSHSNIILLRYAEVLLTFAEAKNELEGPSAEVYAALNQIRDRAGMPNVDESVYGSKDALRDLIRNERRIELALEGHRYMDIRRWEIAPQVMNDINNIENTRAQSRYWDDRFYLMPVPQSQIDLSDGILTQNPGY